VGNSLAVKTKVSWRFRRSTNKHVGVYCLVQLGFLETKTFKYPQYEDLSKQDFVKQYKDDEK